MTLRFFASLSLLVCLADSPLTAQGVVVDEGRFAVTIDGRSVGTEEFAIRRAGFGRDDAIFANAVVLLSVDGRPQELRPLLRAVPPDGVVAGYQIKVVGTDAMDLQMTRAGGRYVAIIQSEVGEEDREFLARANTRVLDLAVAHQYYFLKDLREGATAHTLQPRSRTQTNLTAGAWVDEELAVGGGVVAARRVEFSSGDDRRIVWFDRLGRVLRVEVPSLRYVAERQDLVG